MPERNMVPFRLTEAAAKRLLSQIAERSADVIFTEHAVKQMKQMKQMKQRRITRPQVINCLKKGSISEPPYLDHHGLWKVTIERYASGENIGCAVAIDNSKHKSIVITAFKVNS